MATNPLYHDEEWEEYTYDAPRFFRAVLIAIPIAVAMWAGLFYLARWIWHVIWAFWSVWV